jgi:hypothetical protein
MVAENQTSPKPFKYLNPKSLFVVAENKRLKVLLADLCERKALLAG